MMLMRHPTVSLVLLALLLPFELFADDEFWSKPPEQWTQEEIGQLLTDSPWATAAKAKYAPRAPGVSAPPSSTPGPFPSPGGGNPPIGIPRGGPGGSSRPLARDVLVRWQSALPIRQALNRLGKGDLPGSEAAADYYIIAESIPTFPDFDESGRPAPSEEEMLQRLRDNTHLYIGGDSVVMPDRVSIVPEDDGFLVLLFFKRSPAITLGHKKVKVVSRMGPVVVSAEFKLKEMQYLGKLEL